MKHNSLIEKGSDKIIIQINVLFTQEDDNTYIAYCPVLELSSYGDNIEDAKEAFNEALTIFIKETTRKGTLEKELLSLGWTLRKKPEPEYHPPPLKKLYRQLLKSGASRITEQMAVPV